MARVFRSNAPHPARSRRGAEVLAGHQLQRGAFEHRDLVELASASRGRAASEPRAPGRPGLGCGPCDPLGPRAILWVDEILHLTDPGRMLVKTNEQWLTFIAKWGRIASIHSRRKRGIHDPCETLSPKDICSPNSTSKLVVYRETTGTQRYNFDKCSESSL